MNNDNKNIVNNYKEEKKSNLFNIIIGIATLLIALLGATFAYFSATASSDEGDVNLRSAYLSISYDGGTKIEATELIPASLNVALTEYRYPTYGQRCLDAKGKQVCYVYQFTVSSDVDAVGNTDITGYIKVDSNGFQNLSYVLYEVQFEQEPDGSGPVLDDQGLEKIFSAELIRFGSNKTQKDENPDISDNSYGFEDIDFLKFEQPKDILVDDNLSQTVYPIACLFGYKDDFNSTLDDTSNCNSHSIENGKSHVFQLVVWLEETGDLQEEQAKGFAGTVKIDVNGSSSAEGYDDGRITGTLE